MRFRFFYWKFDDLRIRQDQYSFDLRVLTAAVAKKKSIKITKNVVCIEYDWVKFKQIVKFIVPVSVGEQSFELESG